MEVLKMKVTNMTSAKGNKIANQFIITDEATTKKSRVFYATFQSYDSIIADRTIITNAGKLPVLKVRLDKTYWDYSVTTSKYRNLFLGETKKETQAKIDSGEYILTDLN